MTAFHQACQSLYMGESEMSIVGGANCIINPEVWTMGHNDAETRC